MLRNIVVYACKRKKIKSRQNNFFGGQFKVFSIQMAKVASCFNKGCIKVHIFQCKVLDKEATDENGVQV